MKPPFSYYGGKQRMSGKILPLIPKHTVYVEPYCGGATIFFAKPWPKVTNQDHYREVLNDCDHRIINFYRVLQDPVKSKELIRRLELTPYSREEHQRSKELLSSEDSVEAAWAWFVKINTSFSNDLHGGWRRSLFSRDLGQAYINQISRLPEYLDRMSGVYLECNDALKVIEDWDSPQTFFYCDPPYPNADQGHYSGYILKDFESLCDVLDNCQGSFLLSNYDQPNVNIPEQWERFEFDAYSSSALDKQHRGKRTEVVWRMDRSMNVKPEIKKLFNSGRFDCFGGSNNGSNGNNGGKDSLNFFDM